MGVLTRKARWVLAAAVASLVVFAAWMAFGWGGPIVTDYFSDVASLGFSVLAFTCVANVARITHGRRRLAWSLFAVGLSGWVAGDLTWLIHSVVYGIDPSTPSLIDVAYLTLRIATCAAWSVNAPRKRLPMAVRPLLDGLIVASSLFMVLWVLALRTLFAAHAGDEWALVVSLTYPILDLVMVTMALIVTSGVPYPYRRSMALATTGLIAIAVTDIMLVYPYAFGTTRTGLLSVGWATGLIFISAAALVELRVPDVNVATPRGNRALFWLPYAPLPFAMAIGAVHLWHAGDGKPVLIAGLLLVTVALVRQFTVLTENRRLLDTVAQQALRDPLTGLGNRLLFSDRLEHAMTLRHRDGRDVAVLSLDLDDFKLVNDNLGHPSGDSLLRAVAQRLLAIVPEGDTVARLGGDEFAVLIEDGPEAAGDVAQRVVEMFDKPFFLDGEEIYMHPSIGLASAAAAGESATADELFHRADVAMYAAKRAGIGGVQEFTSDMRHVDRTEIRASWPASGRRRTVPIAGIQLLGQLRRAIDEGELALVYQPKISLTTGSIVGVEALVRWPHPTLGLLTPNQFLPLVRQNGLMGAVTDLVLDRAVRDATRWYDAGTCDLPVAVNLFAPSLNDLTLPDRISSALDRAGLPPGALSVEITEHLLLANIRRASTVIERLRATGLRIAIDDFGSGYATMSYLRDLPIDELKLDRQFIAPVLRSERAAAIVQSVIDLAHALGIACVAEGVEDKGTADRLRDYGCDIAQGHYFSRPMPADVLLERCQLGASSSAIFPITS